MRKILLINTNTEKRPYPVPPLGLCLLASQLEKEYTVKIYDGVFDEGKGLPELVKQCDPDFIGFSIRNIDDVIIDRPYYYVDRIISDFIKPVRKISTVPLILGGSGFSIFPQELMQLTGADYGIKGEAEQLLPALLERIEKGEGVGDLPGVYQGSSLSVNTKPKTHTPDIGYRKSDIRYPVSDIDRHINFTPYQQKGVYSIQTKRGCSHGCIYCTYPVIEGKMFRTRNPEDIASEIEEIHRRLGDITFEFVDSTFNDPEGHAEAICRAIIKKKIRVRLRTMGINPRHTSEELFELMMEAGFTQIDATPDSASPLLLKNLDKGFMLPDIERMALLIKKFNLPTMWFFLFGGPGEDESTIRETFDFIDSYINPDDLVYMNYGLRIYPGTPLSAIALKEGKISNKQSLLHPAVFYISDKIGKKGLANLLQEAAATRNNCLPSDATVPQPEMIREANELRIKFNLTEPMFRTLLRIRKRWIAEGREV